MMRHMRIPSTLRSVDENRGVVVAIPWRADHKLHVAIRGRVLLNSQLVRLENLMGLVDLTRHRPLVRIPPTVYNLDASRSTSQEQDATGVTEAYLFQEFFKGFWSSSQARK